MKTRPNAPSRPAAPGHDKARPAARPAAGGPGNTEATRPRDEQDATQKGPGSAGADLQMTADGGQGGRRKP